MIAGVRPVTYEFPDIQCESIIPPDYVPKYSTLFKLERECEGLRFKAFLTAFYDTSGKRQKFASALWDLALCFDNAIKEAKQADLDRQFQASLSNGVPVTF